jgi:sialic acid synthase SpsE
MAKVILDFGSGNTCRNNADYACKMIDAVKAIDSGKHEIIIKWQLFESAPPNIPLDWDVFDEAYAHARKHGYKTTASVFDTYSLEYLLAFDIPFVKIPCRPNLYWLIGEVPRKIPLYVSIEYGTNGDLINFDKMIGLNSEILYCVPKYPALFEDYDPMDLNISDHTVGLDLWNWGPHDIWEKHFVLERTTDNPDSGPFAVTPSELSEIM